MRKNTTWESGSSIQGKGILSFALIPISCHFSGKWCQTGVLILSSREEQCILGTHFKSLTNDEWTMLDKIAVPWNWTSSWTTDMSLALISFAILLLESKSSLYPSSLYPSLSFSWIVLTQDFLCWSWKFISARRAIQVFTQYFPSKVWSPIQNRLDVQ